MLATTLECTRSIYYYCRSTSQYAYLCIVYIQVRTPTITSFQQQQQQYYYYQLQQNAYSVCIGLHSRTLQAYQLVLLLARVVVLQYSYYQLVVLVLDQSMHTPYYYESINILRSYSRVIYIVLLRSIIIRRLCIHTKRVRLEQERVLLASMHTTSSRRVIRIILLLYASQYAQYSSTSTSWYSMDTYNRGSSSHKEKVG